MFALSLAAAAGGGACSGATSDDSGYGGMSSATGGAPPVMQLSLEFQDTPIQVLPRQVRPVSVRVSPAGAHTVRFVLLGLDLDSAPLDAALDRSVAVSDAAGVARVTLTAPSVAADFLLRAQVGTSSAVTSIAVSPGTFVNLEVHPEYGGARRVTEWVASAHVGIGCEALDDPSAFESPLLVRGGKDTLLRLEDVPAADKLAITLRANSFARGCTTVEHPLPDADTSVVVQVDDLPLDLANTELEVLLGVAARDAAFGAELDAALELVKAAMLNGAPDDWRALLDDMQASLRGAHATRFFAARADGDWDLGGLVAMGRGAETRLSDAIVRYSRIGRAPLFGQQAFEGRLGGQGARGAAPDFELYRVAGIAVDELGLSARADTWSVDALDTLAFSATVTWPPSELLTALCQAPASAETGALDVPSALAELYSCARVANTLASGAADSVIAFASGCAEACIQDACEAALARLWERARRASGAEVTEMSVLATGAATVGSERQAIALAGTWVGRLTQADLTTQSGGPLAGYQPRQ